MTNRMGGIARIEIAPLDSFDSITVTSSRCSPVMKTGREWLELQLMQHRSEHTDDTSSTDDGLLTSHSLTVPFYPDDEPQLTRIFSMTQTGLIARLTFISGDVRILGSLRYPAFGTCLRRSGQQPSDSYHYELSLDCHSSMKTPVQ